MVFISWTFILFLAASVVLYYLVPGRWRWTVLLAASLVFYLSGGVKPILYLLFTVTTTYAAGLLLERLNGIRASVTKADKAAQEKLKKKKQAVVAVTLIFNFGMLYCLKYLGFTVNAALSLFSRFGWQISADIPDFLLPLGVSFFIFQTTGYVIDCYRGKYPAQRNFLKYALFASFFPQIVQGPIARYDRLTPTLYAPNAFRAENLRGGIQLMLWGYLKKMVIADRAAVVVNTFFADYDAYGGAVTAFSVLFYCINLYCDFSGGIDITRGAAQCFGVETEKNFERPIFASSLAEYWRRWHITLGGWMRDYVFYPISLSKSFGKLGKWSREKLGGRIGKIFPTSCATFIVYLLIGIWHGANFRYIFYGFFNGALITSSLLLAGTYMKLKEKLHINDKSRAWTVFCVLRTCLIVFLGRYITRSPRLLVAFQLLARTFNPLLWNAGQLTDGTLLSMGLTAADFAVVGISVLVMLLLEWYEEKHGSVRDALAKQNAFVQWLAMLLPMIALLLFGIFRGSYIASEFIYKQY
ncbi:MAG: MBOAT family protein [Clostridia bacterium]|nr:MBOAT family protein [Clostridia bacterium]